MRISCHRQRVIPPSLLESDGGSLLLKLPLPYVNMLLAKFKEYLFKKKVIVALEMFISRFSPEFLQRIFFI